MHVCTALFVRWVQLQKTCVCFFLFVCFVLNCEIAKYNKLDDITMNCFFFERNLIYLPVLTLQANMFWMMLVTSSIDWGLSGNDMFIFDRTSSGVLCVITGADASLLSAICFCFYVCCNFMCVWKQMNKNKNKLQLP